MSNLDASRDVLRNAIERIRELAAKSLEAGEFDEVRTLATVAKGVEQVLANSSSGEILSTGDSPPPEPIRTTSSRTASLRSLRRAPAFFREGDSLIKVGRAKRRGQSYEHRAQFGVTLALAKALASAGANRRLVSMEAVLPLHDQNTGREIPSYQAYLSLAWLRSINLIRQQGRRGYIVPSPRQLIQRAQSSFESMPQRGT